MLIKKLILVIFILCTVTPLSAQTLNEAIEKISKTLGEQLTNAKTKRLAVASFSELNGNDTALGDYISEELTTALFGAGEFVIVERREYNRLLEEQERYGSGAFSADKIPELGKQLGVEAIITGSITMLNETVRINARAISVESTRVFAAASGSVKRSDDINALLGQRSLSKVAATVSVPGTIPQSAETVFENDFLRVTPIAVMLSEDKTAFTITTEFKNLTSNNIYIAYIRGYSNLSAVTKHGDLFVWSNGNMTGLPDLKFNLKNATNYALIQPQKTITVVWKAKKTNQKPIIGNTLSISGNLYRFERGDGHPFKVVFDNIRIK